MISRSLNQIYQEDVSRFFRNELFDEGFFRNPDRAVPRVAVFTSFQSTMNAFRQPYGTMEEVICRFDRESLAAMGFWLIDAVYARASLGLVVSSEQNQPVNRLLFKIQPDYEEPDSNEAESEGPYIHQDGAVIELAPFQWLFFEAIADYHKPDLKVFIHVLYDELRARRNILSINGRASSMLYLAKCFLWASYHQHGRALISGTAEHQFRTNGESCWVTLTCGQKAN